MNRPQARRILITTTLVALLLPATAAAQLVMGPDPGSPSVVRVITPTDDRTVNAYPAFEGGVSVTLGDVDGDGTLDLITGAGPGGGPHVRVLSGTDFHELHSFFAYTPGFLGGVHVATGDINGDGHSDIITGAGPGGGPHVQVFSGVDLSVMASFFAYEAGFTGGVHVAAGDVNGDGRPDIVTGPGPGGGPLVQVFSGLDLHVLASFFAYDPRFAGGVDVAAGDINGDGRSDIVTGAGPGGGPHVEVFSGADLSVLVSIFAYDAAFSGGVHVAAGDLDGDGRSDLITGAGPGGAPHVRVWSGVDLHELASFFAFAGGSGVTVGSVGDPAAGGGLRFSSASSTSFLVGSPGTFTVTTVATPPATLSVAGTLPAGVTFVNHGDGTATLAGTPGAGTAGTHALTFTAANGVHPNAVQSFTLTVQQVPAITSANAATFTTGTPGTFTVTATGVPMPALTQSGVLPAGVTFLDQGNGTALLSGMPAAGTAGSYALQFTASNGAGTAVQSFALTVLAGTVPPSAPPRLVMGAGPGSVPAVRVISATDDRTVEAYTPTFLGGVSVTLGDIDGDGTADVITGAGPGGGPHVRVLSGTDLHELRSFFAYTAAFRGGVHVAAGDINGDGRTDIITGAGSGGGPHVQVFSGVDLTVLASFFAYDAGFSGGVYVAAGDVDGDGRSDIVTGAGAGGAPHVRVFSGVDLHGLASFFAYDPGFTGGVDVAAGDINGDGRADLVTGAGPGGSPHVKVFSGADLAVLASFFAYDAAFHGGVRVAAGDVDGDGRSDLVTGAGPGGNPHVRVFSGVDLHELASFFAFASGSGVSVGSTGDATGLRFTSQAATSFQVSTAGTFTVTATGTPTPALAATGALPTGVTFVDNGDGTATLAGTPGAATGGAYPLTLTASNGLRPNAVQAFTLTVQQPPAITSTTAVTFSIGAPGAFSVTTTGFPAPTLTLGGVALPAGVTFVDNGNGTGSLSGTAAAGTNGSYALTLTAANGIGSNAVQSFTLTVDQAAAFTSASATTFSVGVAGTFTVTTTGSPAVTSIARTGAALPSGVTYLDNANGTATLSGTPAVGTGGVYTFTFTINNGVGGNVTQTFALTITEAPAFTSATSTTFTVGDAGSFSVTTTAEPDVTTITLGGAALPTGVTFVNNGNGTATLSGTPAAGTGGPYALTFTANNGIGGNVVQNFTLTVTDGPAFTSAAATTFTVGVAGTFTVTTAAVPPVTVITRFGDALPSGVAYVDNANGTATLSGTPALGTGDVYTFTFTINNGVGPDVVQVFVLTIAEAPVFTSANATTFTVGSAGSFTVTTTAQPDVTTMLTLGGVALPAGVTFNNNGNTTATLSGTPAAGTGGSYALTFTANNGIGGDVVQNFTLTINEPLAVTSGSTATFELNTQGTFQAVMTGIPAPTVSVTAGTLPAGLTLSAAGVLSGLGAERWRVAGAPQHAAFSHSQLRYCPVGHLSIAGSQRLSAWQPCGRDGPAIDRPGWRKSAAYEFPAVSVRRLHHLPLLPLRNLPVSVIVDAAVRRDEMSNSEE